ncbi:flagellar hook protein flgE [Asticcacaulis biprosthecium C19]|uniref:Flagellar hook protein FlgE n=1 Tax=Asticcacaulis biprosthecium C19 TaxID=715226 RepID=F4QMK2_9CAUL|nr:flagellar hook-basal body complex protein [Asticcacaulis biprosthecium]EGF91443.1 flagellar hook protein flgE [Asticcacaulis biprosthecium C19]
MTINRAMQSGVTALAANASALSTISNNIANANTTGYKRVTTNFTNLVSGTSGTATYASNGVTAAVQQNMTARGELNAASSGYSLGIDGQGFFVTSDTSDAINQGSTMLFTRDGSFNTDTSGYLRNAAGLYLQGWQADSSGTVNPSSTDITRLGPINVANIANRAESTTRVSFDANLDSSTDISDAAANGTYDATSATAAMSVYDAAAGIGTKPDSTVSMTVSDSLGQQHTVTMSLLKRGTDAANNTLWDYEVWSPDVTDTAGLAQLATGTLAFNPDGTLDLAASTTNDATGAPGAFTSDYTIGASNSTAAPRWNNSFGAAGQSLSMGLSGASPTSEITHLAGDSTTTRLTANGTEFGLLTKVEIDKDGIVTAIYNNGNTRTLAQVALATFINANGLTPISGNAFTVSSQSGGFTLREPGEGGAGNLAPAALEASTVDLAQEFTGLITTQRAYSAASKIITTSDEMLQELLALKR